MTVKKRSGLEELLGVAIILISLAIVFNAHYALGQYGPGNNNRNYTVRSTVNITNSIPEITAITITPNPLTLTAGSTTVLEVNVTVRDFEGFGDIVNVNVSYFDSAVNTTFDPDDNNSHYFNTSCTQISTGGFFANYTCLFDIYYYANNGTGWIANVSVRDNDGADSYNTNTSTINTLLAINVTDVIDFGNLAVGDTSATSVEANVTNFGNTLINVSLRGFGSVPGDGLAMTCEQRNISLTNERYSTVASDPFGSMTAITGSAVHVGNFFELIQRHDDAAGGEILNSTYWRLQVPISTNPAGQCNGSIVFQAELP